MAQESKWNVHDNVWEFTVTDPQLHKKGFTVYKVICKTFPIKSPESLTELVYWKRYNDFKTLYKSLSALHKALHRRDQFPEFAKPKLFGRFDDGTIEERRQSAAELLNFVSTQPHLYKSIIFRKFLEDAKSPSNVNPKGLDILAAAGSGHPRSEGYPPPDIVPTSTSSFGSSREVTLSSLKERSQSLPQDQVANEQAQNVIKVPGKDLQDPAMLEGTWNFPQRADNISLDSSDGNEGTIDSFDDMDAADEDIALASSLPDTDLAFFDPMSHEASVLHSVDGQGSGGMPRSNSWLLKGLNICAEMETGETASTDQASIQEGLCDSGEQTVCSMSTGSTVADASEKASSLSSLSSACGKPGGGDEFGSGDLRIHRTMSQSSDGSKVACGKGDLDLSMEWSSQAGASGSVLIGEGHSSTSPNLHQQQVEFGKQGSSQVSSRSHSANSDKSQDSDQANGINKTAAGLGSRGNLLRRLVSSVGSNKTSPSRGRARAGTDQSVSSMDLGGKEDYIYLAASQISMAQNNEVNGDYEVAFAYYKSGVGILLQGVQGDTNKARRDAVRRKTAQYLMKAEDLFNRHLAADAMDERRWAADSFLSPSLDLDPSFAFIRGSVRELRNFQVLGTIGKVILVRDKTTDETFVIKSIPKCPPDTGRIQSILPTSCPHMVSLHRFFETDSCVFLLLQYASGGKLWTYIGDYLHRDQGYQGLSSIAVVVDAKQGGDNHGPSDAHNIYSGIKVESETVNEPCSEDSELTNKKPVKNGFHEKISSSDVGQECFDVPENGDNATIENSDGKGVVRFSDLQRKRTSSAVLEDVSVCPSVPSSDTRIEGEDTCQSISGELKIDFDFQSENEIDSQSQDTLNDSGLECMPNFNTKTPLNRRFSSISDDVCVSPGIDVFASPSTQNDEDGNFQQLLGQTKRKQNLEDFSINSIDSEDVPFRLNSSSSSNVERIPSIPEDPACSKEEMDEASVQSTQTNCDKSRENVPTSQQKLLVEKDNPKAGLPRNSRMRVFTSRHISVDEIAASVSNLSIEAQVLVQDAKRRYSSTDEIYSARDSHIYAQTFNAQDLIRSSQDLLRHVDSFLSEGGNNETTNAAAPLSLAETRISECSDDSQQANVKQTSNSSNAEMPEAKQDQNSVKAGIIKRNSSIASNTSSAEEPSIYDLNRSTDEEDSESKEERPKMEADMSMISEETSDSSLALVISPSPSQSDPALLNEECTGTDQVSSKLNDIEHLASCTATDNKMSTVTTTSNANTTTEAISTATTNSANRKLAFSRLDSKDMTRSASFECDLKSPTRHRARSVAAMFEHLDSVPAEPIHIPEPSIKKWTAQMVAAVARLHSVGIVCRDLKPDNILLGEGGQVMMTYFCLVGDGDQALDWDAVDHLYAAPEVSSVGSHDKSCDWWSIGALLFELLVGRTLRDCHPGGITSHTCLHIPTFVSDEAKGLLEGLLTHNPNERLGAGMAGAEEIKAHPFFTGIDWHQLENSQS